MKRYDREYFDHWYRDPQTKISTAAELTVRVAMVVGVAEYILGREVSSVLDVGCGEGAWREPLRSIRPALSYRGIDASEYAVARFGDERNIQRGSFGGVGELVGETYDVVICADTLHYVTARELERGLAAVARIVRGVAYLPLFTQEDDPEGDLEGWYGRSAEWYRTKFDRAGLVACGLHFYVSHEDADARAALERIGV